jgi:hypothetical protein
MARDWYKTFGFIESPTDEFHLFLLIQDLESNAKVDSALADDNFPATFQIPLIRRQRVSPGRSD